MGVVDLFVVPCAFHLVGFTCIYSVLSLASLVV